MQRLILIGIILFVSVLVIDLMVRIGIVCHMRKQRRAVKPMDVAEGQVNNGNLDAIREGIAEDASETSGEDIENRSIPRA